MGFFAFKRNFLATWILCIAIKLAIYVDIIKFKLLLFLFKLAEYKTQLFFLHYNFQTFNLIIPLKSKHKICCLFSFESEQHRQRAHAKYDLY